MKPAKNSHPNRKHERKFYKKGIRAKSKKMAPEGEFTALVHKEDNLFVAECVEIGTVSQGRTINEAVKNLKEATKLYLEGFPLKEKRRAEIRTFEVAISAPA